MTISLIQVISFLVVLGYMVNIITGIYILALYIAPALIQSIIKKDMDIILGPKSKRKVTVLIYCAFLFLIVVPFFFSVITLNLINNGEDD